MKVDIRSFTQEEVSEINNYISTQIPQTILPQLFVLTEEPEKKSRIFIAIYRILYSVSNYVESKETKDKIILLLDEVQEPYNVIYSLILKHDSSSLLLSKKRVMNDIMRSILKYNTDINSAINSFLVFAEKIELTSADNVAGIKLDEDLGKQIVQDVRKFVSE